MMINRMSNENFIQNIFLIYLIQNFLKILLTGGCFIFNWECSRFVFLVKTMEIENDEIPIKFKMILYQFKISFFYFQI